MIADIPDWVKSTFPGTLLEAFYDFIRKPITKGMKEALDNDNINDVVFYGKQKKLFKGLQINAPVKGTDMTPLQYASENKKYKSLVYLITYDGYSRKELIDPFKEGKNEDDSPKWYQYFYLYKKGSKAIKPQYLYSLFMESKRPFECLNFIFEDKPNLSAGSGKPEEYDVKFYKSLDNKDKNSLLNLIMKDKINLQVQNYIMNNDGNLLRITLVVGEYYLADYCIKNNKISAFKKFVDDHNELFEGLKLCHIIMPQFKELYLYAYAKHHYSYLDNQSDEYKYINEHALQLGLHGYYNELKFMLDKDFSFQNDKDISLLLKGRNIKILDLFDSFILKRGMDYMLENLDGDFYKFYALGYTPTMVGIRECIKKKKHPLVKNLKIFKYLPDDEKIDSFKPYMIKYQLNLVPEFISKYEDTFTDKSLDSWGLKGMLISTDHLKKALRVLGYDPDDYIDQSNDDDDDDDDDDNDRTARNGKTTGSKYCCKFCSSTSTSDGLKNLSCSKSPTKKHVVFQIDNNRKYYCQMCGMCGSPSNMCSSRCSKSLTGYHTVLTTDSKNLACMFCGSTGSSYTSFSGQACKRSPKGYHIIYDGNQKQSCSCRYCSKRESSISFLAKGDCKKSPTGHHVPVGC